MCFVLRVKVSTVENVKMVVFQTSRYKKIFSTCPLDEI